LHYQEAERPRDEALIAHSEKPAERTADSARIRLSAQPYAPAGYLPHGVGVMDFQWRESMSVGVAEFDRDHQHLLGLAEKTAAALTEGAQGRARELINSLLVLAADHTAREQAFLRRIGYPGVDHVTAVQRDALSRIAMLYEATPEETGKQIADIGDAFIAYLLRADINYKSFVEAAGLSDTGRRS
jgi:hemerythrin